MPRRIKIFTLLLLLLPWSFLVSQDKKSGKDSEQQPTFRLPVNVVVVHATVNDPQGNPVTDLEQSDFKIYEDGKPREINTFARESYIPYQEHAEDSNDAANDTTASPRFPASSKPTQPRMVSILIDDLTMGSLDHYPRLIKALQDYIANDLSPLDQVAILSGSGRMRFPFSDDKQMLLDEAAGVLGKLNFGMVVRETCPEITNEQAYNIAALNDKTEVIRAALKRLVCLGRAEETMLNELQNPNLQDLRKYETNREVQEAIVYVVRAATKQYQEGEYRTYSLLDTLRQHIRSLKHFDAKKSLVLFSEGFLSKAAGSMPYQLQEIVDLALHSGVILNCVNIRGLESGIDASKTIAMNDALNDVMVQEAPLEQLSYDTGGQLFHNNNNLYQGLKQIVRRQSHYYILTYATPSQKADGSYHRIKLEVSRPGLEISYRKGYYDRAA